MKTKEFEFHAESIGTSANFKGELVVVAGIDRERFLSEVASEFYLRDLLNYGSYSADEVMDEVLIHFGGEEVFNYVMGLGER